MQEMGRRSGLFGCGRLGWIFLGCLDQVGIQVYVRFVMKLGKVVFERVLPEDPGQLVFYVLERGRLGFPRVFEQDDMPAELGSDRGAGVFSRFEGRGRIGEGLQHLAGAEPG